MENKTLSVKTVVRVRFSEVDSMQIAWHGSYIKYLEDAREAFGREFGIGYLDVYAQGYMIPIVHIECDYKNPLRYGDIAIVEATFVNSQAAKIEFNYRIYNQTNNQLLLTANTVQVFLDKNAELYLTLPLFFEEWKIKHGLI